MNNTKAILIKQMRSLLKNPVMIIQAVIYIVLALVLTLLAGGERNNFDCDICIPAYECEQCVLDNAPLDTPNPSLAGLFAVMFIGLSLVCFSSLLIHEDKATQNLRFMNMAGVKPKQYMLGTIASMTLIAFALLILFMIVGWYIGRESLWFLSVGMSGAIVSMLLGITVGMSKYPIIATPLCMILGLGPMLSTFNEGLAHILRFTYTQQVNFAFSDLNEGVPIDFAGHFLIIAANGVVVLLLFIWVNRKGTLN